MILQKGAHQLFGFKESAASTGINDIHSGKLSQKVN